jgi:hypothetical protein
MPIEPNVQYVDDLNVSNPPATDPLSQVDDHLRLLKTAVKQSFPNITGAMTATHTVLNGVDSRVTALEAGGATAIKNNSGTPELGSGITVSEVKSLLSINEPAITSNGSTPSLSSGISAAEVRSLIGAANILDVYPVGAIYTSVVSTSPASLFGGTWQSFAAGRVLVGINSSDGDFNQSQETGGAKTHTLTVAQMPSHAHGYTGVQGTGNPDGAGDSTYVGNSVSYPRKSELDYEGGGAAHNNLQPYIVVYMWKRTA